MTDCQTITLPPCVVSTTHGELDLAQCAKGWLVLYFYPKDATSGCTTQAVEFSALYPEFQTLGVTLIGVSRDSLASHQRFSERQQIAFALISDNDESLCRHFKVIKEKNMFGKKGFGIERSTFIFHDGKLVYSEHKVKAAGHAAQILDRIKAHSVG